MNQQMLANPGTALKPLPRSPKAPLSGALLGEFGTLRSILSLVVLSTLLLPGIVSAQSAERPNSDELLPETTVAYVQIQNVRELFEKMGETNMGKMMEDENIAPLVGDLFQTAQDAYAEVEDRVGLSLEEIQSLPAGEICFAVIAPKRKPAAFVLIVDTDEESEAVDKALERGRDLAEESDVEIESEDTDDVTFEKFSVRGQQMAFFRLGGTVVVGNSQPEMEAIVERWMGREVEKIRPLKENRKFITIMNRCRGTKDVAPDMRFFADPIAFARTMMRGNPGAQIALNFLPILGLDGLLGVGGAAIMDELDCESVFHLHVLLSNPREGIFEMLALKPGDYEPEPWVPHDATFYTSTSWDVQKMLDEFVTIFESFNGEGSFAEDVEEEIMDEFDIDFRTNLIDQLEGRLTFVQWVGEEVAVNGQTFGLGAEINDHDEFMKVLDAIRDKADDDNIEEVDHKGITFWQMATDQIEKQRERMRESEFGPPVTVRIPQFCWGIIDNHFLLSDSPDFFKLAIETTRGKEPSLLDSDEYQKINRQMTRLLGTDVPGAVMISRPADTFKMFFELAQNEDTRGFLDEMADDNDYAKGVRDAIENNPLPDFEDIRKYFQPSGMYFTNDDTGYHMLGFQMKSDDE